MTKKVDKYTLLEKIGSGNYGMVYKATHQTKPVYFAVKVIPHKIIDQNTKLEQCLNNQIQALSKIQNCEHIIKYFETIQTKNNRYFVYQFCNGGNLYQLMQKQGCFDETKALKIVKQIVSAFKVLNKINVMHRDLKPDNIFMHNGHAKVGDFGFCKALKMEENLAKTMLGSPIYMAPEILKGQLYSTKADIWSLGVILYQMIFGYCPYTSSSIAQLINKITNTDVQFPPNNKISQKTKQLIKKMLNKDYLRRAGWVQLFKQFSQHQNNASVLKQVDADNKKSTRFNKALQNKRGSQVQKPTDSGIENKQNKMKEFYSQKYLNLLANSSKNIEKQKSNEILKKKTLYEKRPSIMQHCSQEEQNIKKFKCQQQQNPSTKWLQMYNECKQVCKSIQQELKKYNKSNIGYSYLVLCKVHDVLKKITEEMSQKQSQYSQFINTLRYQMILVNRQVSFIRQELRKLNLLVPHSKDNLEIDNERILNFVKN